MATRESTARMLGGLLVLHLALLIVPFVLIHPVAGAGFLETAAGSAARIRIGVGLLLVTAAVTIVISLVAFPVVRAANQPMAVALVSIAALWLATQSLDDWRILGLLRLSQDAATAKGADAETLRTMGQGLRATRLLSHYTTLLLIDAWILVFYIALGASGMVARALALFGVAMVVIHAFVVPLPFFLGYRAFPSLAPSIALSHLAFAGSLLFRRPP